ncbi:MAG: DUF3617 domain-containing protein [Wenzhouxiangella sp.]|nr:MAG: DUF3617 domain-containing protein [Wenzhouxiangella sp.]
MPDTMSSIRWHPRGPFFVLHGQYRQRYLISPLLNGASFMYKQLIASALLVGLIATVQAETPNLEPGLWETKATMRGEGGFPMPEQTHTSTDCMTEEDLAGGDAFFEDVEQCEFERREIRRDGADFEMNCSDPSGMSMNMTATMSFHGDTSEGTIRAELETPMGPMTMVTTLEGRRIGDCP